MVRFFVLLCLFGPFSFILAEGKSRLYLSGFDNCYFPNDVPAPPKPLMWIAKLKVDRAINGGYEHRIYEYHNHFELYLGCSGAYLQTWNSLVDEMFVGSTYLLARIYMIRRNGAELFFLYSPGGPSILSKNTFSTTKWTNQFVFQNQFGVGVSLSRFPDLEFFIKQYHYSNCGFFPINGGVDIRLSLGVSLKI